LTVGGGAFEHSPSRAVTRADGAAKDIRIQDGHMFVCNGCCCGRTEKGFPPLALEEFKRQWKERGIRRRFHLTAGRFGPCPLANVVLIVFRGCAAWFHSINSAEGVGTLHSYVEQMLLADRYLKPLAELIGRHFERYIGVGMPSCSVLVNQETEAAA
jgi:cobaltochelatase CobN